MSAHSERFTNRRLGGIDLHTLRWGQREGPILVLLHGGGANAHWWNHLAPSFADRFQVLALDFRGHGDSDRPRELTQDAFHEDLDALLDELGRPEVGLVGHSMGAHIAASHAARSDRVRSLVLIDPARGGPGRTQRRMRLALNLRRSYATAEEAIDRLRFLPPAEHASEELRLSIARHSVQREADGRYGYKFDRRWFSLGRGERPDLSRISCPTLVLRGSESAILTEEGASQLMAELRNARIEVIPLAGHHVQLDNPEAVLAALHDFLDPLA